MAMIRHSQFPHPAPHTKWERVRKRHTKQDKTNRIYRRSLVQAEKSQPEGKRIMPALPVDPMVGFSLSASETDV